MNNRIPEIFGSLALVFATLFLALSGPERGIFLACSLIFLIATLIVLAKIYLDSILQFISKYKDLLLAWLSYCFSLILTAIICLRIKLTDLLKVEYGYSFLIASLGCLFIAIYFFWKWKKSKSNSYPLMSGFFTCLAMFFAVNGIRIFGWYCEFFRCL